MGQREVLVLNLDYTFLNFISTKKALKLITKGKVEVVKYSKQVINTVNKKIMIPLVIKLLKLVRIIYKRRVPFSKKNILIRDGFRCAYCGVENVPLTIDHIVPKSKGGKSSFENCVASCKPCNNLKRDKTCNEVGMFFRTKNTQPTISEFIQIRMKKLGVEEIMENLVYDV